MQYKPSDTSPDKIDRAIARSYERFAELVGHDGKMSIATHIDGALFALEQDGAVIEPDVIRELLERLEGIGAFRDHPMSASALADRLVRERQEQQRRRLFRDIATFLHDEHNDPRASEK